MDPDSLWRKVTDTEVPLQERAEASLYLLEWVYVKHGFLPVDDNGTNGGLVVIRDIWSRCLAVLHELVEERT